MKKPTIHKNSGLKNTTDRQAYYNAKTLLNYFLIDKFIKVIDLDSNTRLIYTKPSLETNRFGFGSLKKLHGANVPPLVMAVFFCALLLCTFSLWAGASVDALGRAGFRVSQSSNPLVTRPPYLEVGSGVTDTLHGGTHHE